MQNLADIIEQFILHKLAREEQDPIVLKRNDLAGELACAPSQISYVLSTRFTIERGFMVESRRGSGGFIRIARIPIETIVYQDAANQINENTSLAEMRKLVERLRWNNMITTREAELLQQFFLLLHDYVDPPVRVYMYKSLLLKLAHSEL